jgi:hypothetical protein
LSVIGIPPGVVHFDGGTQKVTLAATGAGYTRIAVVPHRFEVGFCSRCVGVEWPCSSVVAGLDIDRSGCDYAGREVMDCPSSFENWARVALLRAGHVEDTGERRIVDDLPIMVLRNTFLACIYAEAVSDGLITFPRPAVRQLSDLIPAPAEPQKAQPVSSRSEMETAE